jgi:hypothetical protein
MAKRKRYTTKKDRQHNIGQKKKSYYLEGQTTPWPKEKVILPRRTDNTIAKRKFGHCVVCPSW